MLVLSILLVIALALSVAASGSGVLPGDVAVARFLQRAPEQPFRWPADFGNWIGSALPAITITITVAIVLFAKHFRWEALILLIALAARPINGAMKLVIDSPRPTDDLVRVTHHVSGLGFPSGHASGSILAFGAIAVIASGVVTNTKIKRGIQATCIVLILIVGFGRIYVGAHWPSDVLGGYLWGAIVLAIDVAIVDFIRRRREARQPG